MSAQTRHVSHVSEVAQSKSAAAQSRLAASWRRSLVKHALDPAATGRPRRVTETELSDRHEALAPIRAATTARLDALFGLLRMSGCAVLLTDADGIVLEKRTSDGDADLFRGLGLWPGADWSEAAEGTNGIGTCLTEERPVIIHREEHFFSRNTGMSCVDAPVFGAVGELVGALDVSSARHDQDHGLNGLIGAAVAQTAHRIESDLFRAAHPGARIVDIEGGDAPCLLALDADDLVIGATRAARRRFDLPSGAAFVPRPASDMLGRPSDRRGIAAAEYGALKRALARAGGNASEAARALGIGRATLYRRMKRLGLDETARDLSHN